MSNEETKAKQLVDKFYQCQSLLPTNRNRIRYAKRSAIICCNEILSAIDWHEFETPNKKLEYWQKVISHIEKL